MPISMVYSFPLRTALLRAGPVRWIAHLAALSLLLVFSSAHAETRIGVLYPESAPAFQKLYLTIIGGMGQATDVRVQSRAVSEKDSADQVKSWLASGQSQIVIVLGNVPAALTNSLVADMPLIHGAGVLNDNNIPGVSLASSPGQLFARLKQIKPNVERVFVVYKPQATGWLISAGKAAARDQGLELIATPSEDIQQAAAAFTRILQQIHPGKDAIWLTLDPVVPVNPLLPVLLREAWDKQLALFSNNPLDVNKGALFALYPDYPAMGRQLAERAKKQLAKNPPAGPEASEHLNGALNTRTASHLGIVLSSLQQQSFHQLYPER
jgi:putative tryptophan/tyrosine transport system substrate-binding protein